jgi:c-di-GMP-binding flagellar brake protein YcgR
MPAAALVPISATPIRIGEPLPFPIFDAAGRLLLSAGETPRNARHVERIQEIGMVAAEVVARLEAAAHRAPPAAPVREPQRPAPAVEMALADAPRAADCLLTGLRIPSGTPVQLSQAGDPPRRLSGTLVGVLPRSAVYVGVAAIDEHAPLASGGSPVGFRCVHGTDIVRFEARILRQELVPFPVVVLAYPAQVSVQRFRRHARCATLLDAVATNYNAADTVALPCRITNLSAGGMQLECAAGSMAVGDPISVDVVLPGPPPRYALKLVGTVRNASPTDDPDQLRCGVEFASLDANERLLVEHFVLRTLAERPRMPGPRAA